MSESPPDYLAGQAPGLGANTYLRRIGNDRYVIETRDERITTLEEALLKTWYSGEYDRCEVCLHTQHMESTASGHTPDCLIPSLLERHGE